MSIPGGESPTTLCATTLMVYEVALTKPLSSVLVAEAGSCTGVDPPLGTLVTVYPVTGGLLADNTGGVHVTVMDVAEVAVAVTSPGGGGTGQSQSRIIIDIDVQCPSLLHVATCTLSPINCLATLQYMYPTSTISGQHHSDTWYT